MNWGPEVMPRLNSRTLPDGVIRPIWFSAGSVNQTFPSGPAVMNCGWAPALIPCENSVGLPVGVIRPIRSVLTSVNHTLPSGPAVVPRGPACVLMPGRVCDGARGVIRAMRSPRNSANQI